jgi:hypothetical protein
LTTGVTVEDDGVTDFPKVPEPPHSLVRHVAAGRCVVFVGAGLSAWAGLPTWATLLKRMVATLRDEGHPSPRLVELDGMLDQGKLLEVAEYCRDQLGRSQYAQFLTNELRHQPSDDPMPHQLIVQSGFSAAITTNYDKLLENAYFRGWGISPPVVTHEDIDRLAQLLFTGEFFILKAHGDLDRPGSAVFTSSDYRDLIHANPAYDAVMSSMLITKAVLFIGYSLSDPDFRLLMDRQFVTFGDATPIRYALMREGGVVEQELLWRSRNVRVLQYGQHDQIVPILESLRQRVKEERLKEPPFQPSR